MGREMHDLNLNVCMHPIDRCIGNGYSEPERWYTPAVLLCTLPQPLATEKHVATVR